MVVLRPKPRIVLKTREGLIKEIREERGKLSKRIKPMTEKEMVFNRKLLELDGELRTKKISVEDARKKIEVLKAQFKKGIMPY